MADHCADYTVKFLVAVVPNAVFLGVAQSFAEFKTVEEFGVGDFGNRLAREGCKDTCYFGRSVVPNAFVFVIGVAEDKTEFLTFNGVHDYFKTAV